MTTPTPEVPYPVEGQTPDRSEARRRFVLDAAGSLSLVVGWFAAAGLLGALVWVKVTPLPGFTRIADSGSMDEEQLAKQFSANGWFLIIALVGGLVSGLVLTLLRRRSHPAVLVVLIGLGGALATFVMVQCGLDWGPGDPNAALAKAQLGEVVPVRLQVDAHGVYYAWSIAALAAAAAVQWMLERRERPDVPVDPAPDLAYQP